MLGHARVCMLDGAFLSVSLDASTPYPVGQKGACLPTGDLAFDGQAFAVVAEIERRLTGERTAPLWFLGCYVNIGRLWREPDRDVWFIEVTKSRFLNEQPQYVELTRDEALRWLKANRYHNPSKDADPDTPAAESPPLDRREPEDLTAPPGRTESRRKRRTKPEALVAYMARRESAGFEDLARDVHENEDVTDEAIRQNVSRANVLLEERRLGDRLRSDGRMVYRDTAPA